MSSRDERDIFAILLLGPVRETHIEMLKKGEQRTMGGRRTEGLILTGDRHCGFLTEEAAFEWGLGEGLEHSNTLLLHH